jgi:hypothetical protein
MLTTLLFSLGAYAETYEPNDGINPPGTFTSKLGDEKASTTTSPSGVKNSSGITTDEMNTSPNPAPSTDQEVLENTTLSNEGVNETNPFSDQPSEIEAQEEDALDYSTSPENQEAPQESTEEIREN